jgi:cell division protein FtsB
MNDWDDRAVDAALHELHGSKPPDLSSRVLLALREAHPGQLPVLRRSRAPRPLVAWLVAAAMVLVTVAVTWAYWSHTMPGRTDERIAMVELAVLEGAIEVVEARPEGLASTAIAAGRSVAFAARAGNRLRNRAIASGRLGEFGVVTLQAQTELEVRSMEFTVKNGVVAASALTLSVVAGVFTWHSLTHGETAKAGEVVRMEAHGDTSGALTAENERLRQRVLELERQNENLQASRTAAPPEPAPAVVETAAAEQPAEPVVAALMFDDPQFADALGKVDWSLVGSVTKEMQPLLVELMAAMEKDGEVPQELAIKIQQLNSQLVAQLPAILKAGLPGFGPNGAYTHPLFVANSLASTLAAAGLSLDATQRDAIAGLVRSFSVENQSLSDQPREYDLEKLLAETEMKERFYDEVASRLTPEQYASIYPEGSTDYDGASLFRPSLMTRVYSDGVPVKDAADFARVASNRLGEELGLDEATSTKVRSIVESMAARSPELFQTPANVTETKLRMLRSGRTTAALKQQIAFLREVQRQVKLSPEQLRKLAGLKRVLVPLPR